jgi:eukaryotic-like serine/threonine-protein kinase
MTALVDATQTTSIGGYQITGILGEGGMGKVYIGEHELLGRRAAIKVLLPEYSNDQEVVNRFFNEAKAATAIRHPGIVKVYDFGYQEDGSAYIAMEFMEGEPLDVRLQRMGWLPVEQALRLAGQMASALAAAHQHRIVHRDLKPANVFVVSDPQVAGGERAKLLDFGIAKFSQPDDPDAKQTRAGAILGSPQYMAPEQIRGSRDVDARADLYSLGCILFQMLCGRPPFDGGGNGAMAVMASHLDDPPPMPSSLRADVPREVEALILYLLAKDPAHRYQSAAEVGMAIAAILGEQVSFASMPGVTAELSQVARTAPSGVALSPAGVPLSDSQIISHATSQIGMQSAGLTTVAPVPGSQVRTQAMRLPARRNRMIALVAALVLVAGGSVLALSQMGGETKAASPEVSPGMTAPGGALAGTQDDSTGGEAGEELTPVTFRALPPYIPAGGGEPEVVIEMSHAEEDQGLPRITWRIACQPKCKVTDERTRKVLGESPLRIEFFQDPGLKARFTLSAHGYEDKTITDLSGKEHYDKTFPLVRKLSAEVKVAIECKPGDCEIIDSAGASLGVTPRTLMLPRGEQLVVFTLKREGYEDGRLEVRPDRDRKEKLDLVKVQPMVTHSIRSDPEGATVLNEKKEELGAAPIAVTIPEVRGKVKYYVVFEGDRRETVSVSLSGAKDDSKTVKPKCEERKQGSRPGPRPVYDGCPR